jgi:tetratricopeptide (TPR) repeat protein
VPDPADLQALLKRALAYQSSAQLAEAALCYEQVLRLQPNHFDALHMLGVVAIQNRRFERAVELITAALEQKPGVAAAQRNLALAFRELGRLDDAVVAYDRAITLQPNGVDAYIHLAAALNDLGRHGEALAACGRAIALRPDHPVAHLSSAVALKSLQRAEDALASCDKAIGLQQDYVEAWDKRAAALQDLSRPEEALLSCETAMALRPDFAPAHAHAGMICLQLGNFERGWTLFEWRNRRGGVVAPREFSQPRWSGDESLVGMTLLIYSEQGLGDTLQFCRYAPLLVERGAKVVFYVPRSLCVLLSGLGPGIRMIAETDSLPEFDRHSPLLSLPFALGTTAETIPAAIPYVFAEPARVRRWREKLGGDGFKIGIAWQGSRLPIDVGRSFPVTLFHQISRIPGVRLISLQKGYGCEQLDSLPDEMRVEILGADFDNGPDAFLDTAAVMECLDLIITSDTSIAHLAGALGRPTWVALKHVPEWRWMLERDDSPWYPGHRLFRQMQRGQWEGVFDRMRAELRFSVAPPRG